MSKVKVRYAPSPTGKLHIGNVHTFLFNYAFARSQGGEVMLRIEDTDEARNRTEFVQDIKDALTWLGLSWDGEPEFQSKRQSNYLGYAEKLLASGDAYYCYHTPEELESERSAQETKGQAPRYSGACRTLTEDQTEKYISEGRKPAIRFRMTGTNRPDEIKYNDLVYGEIKYDPRDIGDFVIVRSDRSILYNFANVIDDNLDEITHVIRGQSHLTNTPRQILIYQSLGFQVPRFGHLPEILNPDRVGKLSKRYGAVA
ncbi:MAG TPA: glutamate--tRNA ligase, partial [Patescibacteria group bacterium]|nr:glutamate--tRNA ligase [Patescibacteria group bacterium]